MAANKLNQRKTTTTIFKGNISVEDDIIAKLDTELNKRPTRRQPVGLVIIRRR